MTAEEKKRLFGSVFARLDSDQPGERVAALEKLHSLRAKMGWLSFGDVLRQFESSATAKQLEAAEKNRAAWEQAHNERVTENAALARRNAALAARNAKLRSALWVMMNWRMVAGVAVVAAGGFGGWRVWNAEAAPDKAPIGQAADDSANASLNAALADVLSRAKWGAGDTAPVTVRVNGFEWWIVIRGTVDQKSHVDARGRPIERHCLQLYASEAERDAGAFITPTPYLAFGQWMKWPQRAAECRMPGKVNYS